MARTYGTPVYSADGVVAAPHYQASLAGIDVLRDGTKRANVVAEETLALAKAAMKQDYFQRELRIFQEQAADKPEEVRPRIAEGKLRKWLEEVVLLKQEHVNRDKHGGQTIEDLRADTAARTGENVVIRRFARFAVGDD